MFAEKRTGWQHVSREQVVGSPQIGWSDLAGAVVSWCLEATVGLVDGRKRKAVIRFLDGPFEIRVFAKRLDRFAARTAYLLRRQKPGTFIMAGGTVSGRGRCVA
jgi:hypothetical protein